MSEIIQIVARSKNNFIGANGDIPWKLPTDLQHFKNHTLHQVCIVGRKTYDGIKHLKNRTFIVVTRSGIEYDGIDTVSTISEAIDLARLISTTSRIYIIGGGEIYKESLQYTDTLIVSEVDINIENGDTKYEFDKNEFVIVDSSDVIHDNNIDYKIITYKRK